jgi:hypothetical protein
LALDLGIRLLEPGSTGQSVHPHLDWDLVLPTGDRRGANDGSTLASRAGNQTDSLVTVLNDIIAHPQDLVVGDHSGMQLAGAATIDPAAIQADVD